MDTTFKQYEDIAEEMGWDSCASALEPGLRAISADSHLTEPPEAYSRYIDPAYRDVAPHLARDPAPGANGDVYIIKDQPPLVFNLAAGAGMDPRTLIRGQGGFADLHRGGWDPKARLADQDRDGLLAEVLYPTIGMVLCGNPDADYRHACMVAYNHWLRDFVSEAPDRLIGIGQSAVRSVEDAVADLVRIKELGLKGAMLPSDPPFPDMDYDHPAFDPLWATAVELGLPISFHTFTGRSGTSAIVSRPPRGGKITAWNALIRECQDIIGLFIFGRVFERFPDLRMVCVEADAGWAPHFMSRMDHAYKRHRFWMKVDELKQLPSDYFKQNIYLTFQDDWVAFNTLDLQNVRRIMWANDFPHTDSTWPWSHKLIASQTAALTQEQLDLILWGNVSRLYDLDLG
ncbi:MAG: amidohydrolase family protein [Sphingobium sp.]